MEKFQPNERAMVPFLPYLDRVLVQKLERPENRVLATTAQGEIVQSQHFEKPLNRGIVVAIGTGIPQAGLLHPIPYALGAVIITSEFGGERVYLDPDDEYRKDLPEYWIYRVADTQGEDLRFKR